MKQQHPTLQQLVKEGRISSKTMDLVNIAKSYIEKKYALKKTQKAEEKKGKIIILISLKCIRLG